MLRKRLAAAASVVEQLHPAERALDTTIACSAALVQALVVARIDASLPFTLGQAAMDHFAEANVHLAKARRCFADGHVELINAKRDIGLETRAVGDSAECPDTFVRGDQRFKLVG